MNAPVTYLCEVIFLSGLCYGYYWAALRGGRFHGWNRVYLVGATVLALAIPLMRWSWFFGAPATTGPLGIVQLKVFTLRAGVSQPGQYGWLLWIWVAYGLVSLGILAHRLAGLARIRRVIRGGVVERRAGYRLVRTESLSDAGQGPGPGPFSFFRYVCWSGASSPGPDDPAVAPMLRHEIIHATQHHSADKLFMELVIMLCWVNPFFYLIRKELHLVHEFLADERACGREEAHGYAALLVARALGARPSVLTNAFFQHQLSRRVRMLLGERRPGGGVLRRVLCIPFVLVVSGFVLTQQGGRAEAGPLRVGTSPGTALINAAAAAFHPASDATDPASSRAISRATSDATVIADTAHRATPMPLPVVERARPRAGLEPPPPPPPRPAPASEGSPIGASSPKVFTFVQHMPSFPGGEGEMMRYLSEHIRYPASAREAGHQGTVVVQFEVEPDGSLDHIVSIGAPDGALAAEAVRVVKGMPRWNPGRQEDRIVKVQYSLPIRFVLQ